MTGKDLRRLLLSKWGRSYDLQFRRIHGKMHLLVMWRYLEQSSFPMTELEYEEHLEAVATYLNGWGVMDYVARTLLEMEGNPRLGKAMNIQLDLGDRSSEWML